MSSESDRELSAMQVALGALRDLEKEEQVRVLEWLTNKLAISPVQSTPRGAGTPGAAIRPTAYSYTPKAFLTEKKPTTDVERVACLAYYLTHIENVAEFKTKDLTNLNKLAAQPRMSNPAQAVGNATTQSQYLVSVGGGRKQITTRGEALVEALPDRDRVREALEGTPLAGRKRKRSKTSKRKSDAS